MSNKDKEILDGIAEVTTFSFSQDWYYPWWSNGTLDYNERYANSLPDKDWEKEKE